MGNINNDDIRFIFEDGSYFALEYQSVYEILRSIQDELAQYEDACLGE